MKINEILYERSFDVPLEKRKAVGELIKKTREEKKLTLVEVSEKSRVGISDLHKIENGIKIKINPFQLKAIGNGLNVDYKIFYKIVGFLEEEDFNSAKDNKVVKNELKNFKIELIEKFLQNSKGKISEENFKSTLDILLKLPDSKLESWLSYGEFLIKNTK